MWHLKPSLINQTFDAPLARQHSQNMHYTADRKEIQRLKTSDKIQWSIKLKYTYEIERILTGTTLLSRSWCWSQSQPPQSTNFDFSEPKAWWLCKLKLLSDDRETFSAPEQSLTLFSCSQRLSSFCCMLDSTWSCKLIPKLSLNKILSSQNLLSHLLTLWFYTSKHSKFHSLKLVDKT